ncbi:hypothetical protein ACHAXA_005272 [Cyclostephanos tholiformis]|uniref:Uncharacterized protein n=1 Tax=Cyclostephanos tholiformis TaxID=382380 RepID=A0ABD3R8I1_9STRA
MLTESGVEYHVNRDAAKKAKYVEDTKVTDPFKRFIIPFDSLPASKPVDHHFVNAETPTIGAPVRHTGSRPRDMYGRFIAKKESMKHGYDMNYESQPKPPLSNTEILHNLSTPIFDETSGTNSVSSKDWVILDDIAQDCFDGIDPFEYTFVDTIGEPERLEDNVSTWRSTQPTSPPTKKKRRPRSTPMLNRNLPINSRQPKKTTTPASIISFSTSSARSTRSLSKSQAAKLVDNMEDDVNTPLKYNDQGGAERHASQNAKQSMTKKDLEDKKLVDAFNGCQIPFDSPPASPENTRLPDTPIEGKSMPNKAPGTAMRKVCNHEGCINKPVQGGVCNRHGAKRTTCNHVGCTKRAVRKGVCTQHRAKAPTCKKCLTNLFEEVKVKPSNREDDRKRLFVGTIVS